MATTIDDRGLIRDRLDTILANLTAAYKTIHGDGFDVGPSSADGQLLAAFSEAVDTMGQLLEDVFDSRSPAVARGAQLSRLVQLNGITRNADEYSTADVNVTGTPGTVITDGAFVDNTAVPPTNWLVAGPITIGADGTAIGSVRATTTGPIQAASGTITAIKTVIAGWATITNPAPANLGSTLEADPVLRVRRLASVAIPSLSVIDSLYAALANIQGVSDAAVFENKTGSPIPLPGAADLPPNSIQVVVRGGLDSDIAAAIWAKASGGVTLVGATSAGVVDAQGTTQSIKYDRPIATAVYFDIYLRKLPGQSVSAATIAAAKQALADYGNANSSVGSSVLYAPLFGVVIAGLSALASPPAVAGIGIGSYRGYLSPATADLAIPFNAYPTWDAGNAFVYVYEADGSQGTGFGPY